MSNSRTIRRSGARDLPPSADHVRSEVRVQDVTTPQPGDTLLVKAPCGIEIRVRVREITRLSDGWIGWATQLDDLTRDLQLLGVPAPGDAPMRIFDHQVVNR